LQAIECNWLGPANIDHAIEMTRRRIGFGVQELVFDFDPPGADPLIVSFVSDEFRVRADAMVAELERLREQYTRGDDPAPSGSTAMPGAGQTGTTPSHGGGGAKTTGTAARPSSRPVPCVCVCSSPPSASSLERRPGTRGLPLRVAGAGALP